jgi:uncharacterized protein (TIGR00661 family)
MQPKKLKFIFIVQGEGRGHMTQAISLRDMLERAGHSLECVLVGKSLRREIPPFFFEKIKTEVISFESPNFVTDKKGKAIQIFPTIIENLKRTGFFLSNLKVIDKKVREHNPDVIINFYDLLGGLYSLFYKPKARYVCIGHQYLMLHPDFEFPKEKMVDRILVQMNTRATSFRAAKKIGLSFRPMKDISKEKMKVLPPLLRNEVFAILPENKNYILAYMVNSGYGEDIIKWHESHRSLNLHCFWDKAGVDDNFMPHENLTFHKLNDKIFLEYMKDCSGFVSTAGFESICEAMYLGKPVMMVPTEGQFEQECNAIDAVKSKAGIASKEFDISKLMEYLPKHISVKEEFSDWISQAEGMFLKELID